MRTAEEKEKILNRVAKKAGDYEEMAISCSQGTLAALQEEFNLPGGDDLIKAATYMPGVASRRETCGAVIGGLMALGLKFGRNLITDPVPDTPQDKEEMFRLRQKAWRFCEEFKKEYGSTMCGDIRPMIMGRDYNSMDPADRQQFIKDDGAKKCRLPAEKAARIAASILLMDS